jgi:hypothetical protein
VIFIGGVAIVVAESWRCVFVLEVAAVVVSDRDTTISVFTGKITDLETDGLFYVHLVPARHGDPAFKN